MIARILVAAPLLLGQLVLADPGADPCAPPRGSGDLGIVIERATGSVQIIETTGNSAIGRVEGLGDLSHASAVFSRDGRYAFVFGRDGGLSKVDLLTGTLAGRVVQAGNAIGGAISQSGRLVAVSNYEPGGVRIFDAATLEPVAEIPATYGDGAQRSKVIGLVDAPGERFVFSLWDAGEIWVADLSDPAQPRIERHREIGRQPYDALITPDGRYYIAGLFGEDGLVLLDLWHTDRGVRRIFPGYGRGEGPLPVYKMPHLEGWAVAGGRVFVPAVGRHEVLVVDMDTWSEVGRIQVAGQPVFVMARPDGRQVWVNFALPDNHRIQVIDAESLAIVHELEPGKAVLHMEFEPRGGGGLGLGARRRPPGCLRHRDLRPSGDPAGVGAERDLLDRSRAQDRTMNGDINSRTLPPRPGGVDGTTCARRAAILLDAIDRRLLDDFQSGMPLSPRPFADMARVLGITESEVIDRLRRLTDAGAVSRVGPVFRPKRVGVSTLVAMSAPVERMESVAAMVNTFPEVNHNYEREHRYNLWFYLSHLNYSGRGNKNRGDDAHFRMTREAMDLLIETTWSRVRKGEPVEVVTGNNDADAVYLLHWAERHLPDRVAELRRVLEKWGGNASGVDIANIDNRGEVHPDTFWWDHPLGNVRERPFSTIWEDRSDPLMAGLKQRPRPVAGRCAACAYLPVCNGNTRTRAFQVSGDFWAEDPGCYLTDAEIGVGSIPAAPPDARPRAPKAVLEAARP